MDGPRVLNVPEMGRSAGHKQQGDAGGRQQEGPEGSFGRECWHRGGSESLLSAPARDPEAQQVPLHLALHGSGQLPILLRPASQRPTPRARSHGRPHRPRHEASSRPTRRARSATPCPARSRRSRVGALARSAERPDGTGLVEESAAAFLLAPTGPAEGPPIVLRPRRSHGPAGVDEADSTGFPHLQRVRPGPPTSARPPRGRGRDPGTRGGEAASER